MGEKRELVKKINILCVSVCVFSNASPHLFIETRKLLLPLNKPVGHNAALLAGFVVQFADLKGAT